MLNHGGFIRKKFVQVISFAELAFQARLV